VGVCKGEQANYRGRRAFKNKNETEGTDLPVLPASELQYERLPLIVVDSERT
jgi:hypothetical protein